jgi:hypothetical protein
MFSLDSLGNFSVAWATERELNGIEGGTVDPDKVIDPSTTLDTTEVLYTFFDTLGIYFITTDSLVSFKSNGYVEANEFIEGSRTYIDNAAKLHLIFLKEVL